MGKNTIGVCASCGTELSFEEQAPIGDPAKELGVCLSCGGSAYDPVPSAPWLFVLGVPDPEMIAIRDYLTQCRCAWVWGTHNGKVLTPETARNADPRAPEADWGPVQLIWVECCPAGQVPDIDHHFPGDPGFGKGPENYWDGSSLGQVWNILAGYGIIYGGFPSFREVQADLRIVAAADHCLRDAYAGRCPAVSQDDVAEFRIRTRARHQGRSEAAVMADIEAAMRVLCQAPVLDLTADSGFEVKDIRGLGPIPELPEAACRLGTPFLAHVGDKIVLQVADSSLARVFMECWAPAQELIRIYGDPARGFAGGYLRSE
jgi:hypothetical protein